MQSTTDVLRHGPSKLIECGALESDFPMPYRRLAANALGAFLGAIAQPRRIQIIEELRGGEKDVGTLASTLEITHSGRFTATPSDVSGSSPSSPAISMPVAVTDR